MTSDRESFSKSLEEVQISISSTPVGSTGSCEVEMKEEDVTRLEEEQDDADEKYLKLKSALFLKKPLNAPKNAPRGGQEGDQGLVASYGRSPAGRRSRR